MIKKFFDILSSKTEAPIPASIPAIETSLDVFISYKSEEKGLAGLLVAKLEELGFSVWWDGKLSPGETYQRTIIEKLDIAKSVIVIWSEAAIKSEWVRSEAEHARVRKTLVPIRTDKVKIWPPFNTMHTIDLSAWSGDFEDVEFKAIFDKLRENSGLPPIAQLTRPPVSPGDRIIAQSGHFIHKIKAKDSTGQWAYYYVHVLPHKEKDFMAAIETNSDTIVDLENHGVVIASNYGNEPSPEVLAFLKSRYGFDT